MAEQQQSFTPGPIRIEPQGDGARGYWLHDDDGEFVVMVCRRQVRSEEEGNAALFAAAPALFEALKQADDAIREMFRYFDGGETRGSYDGKPERDQLRKAGYATRAALASAQAVK